MYGSLASNHLTLSLLSFQVVVGARNLMRQCTLLFKQFEVAEAMRAFITQQKGDSEELHSNLKLAEGELVDARKATDEVGELLKKEENERDMANAEARRQRKK